MTKTRDRGHGVLYLIRGRVSSTLLAAVIMRAGGSSLYSSSHRKELCVRRGLIAFGGGGLEWIDSETTADGNFLRTGHVTVWIVPSPLGRFLSSSSPRTFLFWYLLSSSSFSLYSTLDLVSLRSAFHISPFLVPCNKPSAHISA
jgi:hypothetical protein